MVSGALVTCILIVALAVPSLRLAVTSVEPTDQLVTSPIDDTLAIDGSDESQSNSTPETAPPSSLSAVAIS